MRRLDLQDDLCASIAAFVVLVATLCAMAQPASAAFREVSPTGTDTGNDCLIMSGPCATIQHAIDVAENGDWVDVHAGTYVESVTINKPLTLLGPNGGARPGEPQAVLDGGSDTAIILESPRITVRGMSVQAGTSGTAIRASGAIDELTVQENLISGGSSGVRLEAGGKEISIGYNLIEGVENGIRLSGTGYSSLTIQANEFGDSIGAHAVLTDTGTVIKGIDFWGNQVSAPVRITGIAKQLNRENDLGWNSFDSTSGPQLAIEGSEVRIMSNSFDGNGTAGCLQVLGNQGGLVPSTHVLASLDNEFVDCNPYGVELGPGVDDVRIYGNDFPGSYDGVTTSTTSSWNVTGRIEVRDNRFVGTTHLGIDNTAAGTLDAEQNWWGCNGGPGAMGCDQVSGGVYAGGNVTLDGLIGPLGDQEDGLIEIPNGGSITLNPGEKAEVAAVLSTNGSGPNLSVPAENSPIGFSSSLGTLSPAVSQLSNGWTLAIFTAGATPGTGWITVSMDNQLTRVPVTIRGATASTPPIKTVKVLPHPPTVALTRGRILNPGRQITIGTLSCATSCRVRAARALLIIGQHRFRCRVTPRGTLAAESATPIQVALRAPARRVLAKFGSGRIRGKLTVVDAASQTTTRAFSVRVGR